MNSTLEITPAGDITALTTLERVKLELSILGSESDALLSAKIDEATSDIRVRVAPSLRRESVTETIRPEIDRSGCAEAVGAPSLLLKRYPIASITSVTLDDEAVDAAEYYHSDAGAEIGSGMLFRLDSSGYPSRWSFSKSAVVVYAAGYLLPGEEGRNLPPSLEAAAIELVASYWFSRGRDPMLRAESNEGVARLEYWVGAVGASGDLPPGVMAKIEPFRKVGFA